MERGLFVRSRRDGQIILELEPDTVYHLDDQQKKNIFEAKEQIQNKQFLPNEDADKDVDEWLNKQFGR